MISEDFAASAAQPHYGLVHSAANAARADRSAALRRPSLRAPWGRAAPGRGDNAYAELACPRVWTLNDVSLAPTRKVYRLIRAISPSGVLASTFSRVSLRCRLAWKS